MRLKPMQPPGRITRKAREFESEIVQLRADGYTLEAIRQALENAGVQVSLSTVRREALRCRGFGSAAQVGGDKGLGDSSVVPPGGQPQAQPRRPTPTEPVSPPSSQARPTVRSSKEIAASFADELITNPLVLAKEKR
jgi:hypothetical protein